MQLEKCQTDHPHSSQKSAHKIHTKENSSIKKILYRLLRSRDNDKKEQSIREDEQLGKSYKM
jgi:hypothetical protein